VHIQVAANDRRRPRTERGVAFPVRDRFRA
jgi:hypothetical protein